MNVKKAVPGWVVMLLTVIVATAYMLFSHKAHYEVLFPILFIGGIASGLAQKEYKKSQQQNPEMYPKELKPKSTFKKVLLWIGGTIVSLIVVVILLGIAVQMTQDEHPDASTTSSSVKLPELQNSKDNQIFKELVAVNNDVEEDPVVPAAAEAGYAAIKCTKLGNIVTELNEAANKGMISVDSNNIPFIAKLMEEQQLRYVTDYVMMTRLIMKEPTILFSQEDPESLGNSFAFACTYMQGGYIQQYKELNASSSQTQ